VRTLIAFKTKAQALAFGRGCGKLRHKFTGATPYHDGSINVGEWHMHNAVFEDVTDREADQLSNLAFVFTAGVLCGLEQAERYHFEGVYDAGRLACSCPCGKPHEVHGFDPATGRMRKGVAL
jgi:hypothetical protein